MRRTGALSGSIQKTAPSSACIGVFSSHFSNSIPARRDPGRVDQRDAIEIGHSTRLEARTDLRDSVLVISAGDPDGQPGVILRVRLELVKSLWTVKDRQWQV